MLKIIPVLAVLCSAVTTAQNIVPFASIGNAIELSVDNRSHLLASVTVELKESPEWIHFPAAKASISQLNPNSQKAVVFPFSVDRMAPVRKEQKLSFVVSTQSGQSWIKDVVVAVAAPQTFELLQNYPNPLNPSTTIGFQMPEEGRAALRVYNLLGQEIAVLLDGQIGAGYYEARWNAASFSSGIYVYRLVADVQGRRIMREKTMTVLK